MAKVSLSRHSGLCRTTLALALSVIVADLAQAASNTINVAGVAGSAGEVAISANGKCSLIEAIRTANGDIPGNTDCGSPSPGADFIVLPVASLFSLTSVNNTSDGSNALPSITTDISIIGRGSIIRRIPSAPNMRILHIASGGKLLLVSTTISNGNTLGSGAASKGGGVMNRGSLTLFNSTLSGNTASISGGALYSDSTAFIDEGSIISDNRAVLGGGLYNRNGQMSIFDSTISNNQATKGGGATNNAGDLVIKRSTVSANSASTYGGGINNFIGTLHIVNSTLSGNSSAGAGGAIFFKNPPVPVTLTNATISNNTAASNSGSGVYGATGSATLENSIIANNSSGSANCAQNGFVVFSTANNNWFDDISCNGVNLGNPQLGPLADNGGLTRTHALLSGAGPIDKGSDSVCNSLPVSGKDQRRRSRNEGSHCDIGAYEREQSSMFIVPMPGGKTAIFNL